MKHTSLFILLAISLLAPLSAHSKTVYITDQLETALRSGPSNEYRIVRAVKSGDAVKVIDTSTRGFTQIETQAGAKGWILTRYLMDKEHPREQLEQHADTTQIQQELEESLSAATAQIEQLTAENTKVKMELDKLTRTSGSAIAINKQNEELQLHRANLEREMQTLQQANDDLKRSHSHRWFYAGAGILLLGLLLGLLIPKIRFQQRSNWNAL